MAITVKTIKLRSSSQAADETRERGYTAWGDTDLDAIQDALINGTGTSPPFPGIPDFDNGIPLDTLLIDLRDNSPDTWDAVASYAISNTPPTPATGDEEVSFSISPVSTTVTQSLEPIDRKAPGTEVAPDFKGGIGWDGKKFVGTEKQVEAFSFSITKYVPVATALSTTYINSLRSAAFRTNEALFRGFNPGECLYIGATGTQRNSDDYAVTHAFAAGFNATNLQVGEITAIAKKAWEYLWVTYKSERDPAANFVVNVPKSAHIERMYDQADYPTLIGVTP